MPLHAVPKPAVGNFRPAKAAQSMSYSHNQFPNHFGTTDIQEQFEPTYVKLDKQVLRFMGYFKEHVVESRLENSKVRKVTIFYYLEDKSIMVTEPKQVNSGTPQGAFLKRQVVLKPDGCPFMPDDFSIGCDTGVYGRQIRVYDCDDYTRQFYAVSFYLVSLAWSNQSLCWHSHLESDFEAVTGFLTVLLFDLIEKVFHQTPLNRH